MPLAVYPELKNETALPVYVTGVGVSCSRLPERNRSAMIMIAVGGCVTVVVDGLDYSLSEGRGCYVAAGVDCYLEEECASPCSIDWVTFELTSDALRDSLFTAEEMTLFRFNRTAMISEDIRKMLEAVSRNGSYGGFFASSILYATLIELNRETLDLPTANEKSNNAIYAVIEYVNMHFDKNITLVTLCNVAGGLSEQYFCRLFKQHTGTRPMEYILRKRISVARTYLEKTDMPISQIAEKTGFNNTSYFYRNFKKFMGMSPLTCRQNALYINGENEGRLGT